MEIFNNLAGYVTVQGDGYFLERFLNICTRRSLHIWNIRRCGAERLTACMSLPDFRAIRPVCRRTQTRLRILRRHGLPFLLHRYRRRKLSLLGLGLLIAMLWYTSGHIMGITVFGNSRISTETILAELALSGVTPGASSQGIEPARIRNRIMNDLQDLAWIGINVNGSRVYVEVVERLDTAPGVDANLPCSLVAAKDGVVELVEARNGQTMVKKGAGVRAGDVLVSGIMDSPVEGCRYVHAYGEVFAQTRYSLTREYPLTYDQAVDTGRQTNRYALRVLNLRLPLHLGREDPYAQSAREESQREFRIPLDSLPSFFLQKTAYREQTTVHQSRTVAQILKTAVPELEAALRQDLPEAAEVQSREAENALTQEGNLAVTVTLVCRENIAREAPLHVPEETGAPAEPGP